MVTNLKFNSSCTDTEYDSLLNLIQGAHQQALKGTDLIY